MWKIDSTLDALADLISVYYQAAFNPNEDAKKAGLDKFMTEHLPKWCGIMEARLKANSSQHYFVGDNLTIADFALAGVAFTKFLNEANPSAA